jgi:type IV pilus assembly protein PilN
MMRIGVNLASEPFRRDRPMIVASTVVGALMVITLFLFVYLAIAERDRASAARAQIERMQHQLDTMSREETKLQAVMRRPENAEVLDRSVFLNALLVRKGVSWTRIFEDLEKVMPHDVRLMSIRPQINGANQLILEMWVGSPAPEPIWNFVVELEKSSAFGSTTVHNSLPPSQNEPLYRYRVSTNYAQKL